MDDLFTHSYFNTTDLKGSDLDKEETKAKSQDQIVLNYFSVYVKGAKFTSEQVWRHLLRFGLIDKKVPKDSIKRACSNLKAKGKLVFDGKTLSEYNKPIHFYKLVG